jgi:hypothetical protein
MEITLNSGIKINVNHGDIILLTDEFLDFIETENKENSKFDKIQRVGLITSNYFCYWASNKKIPLEFIVKNYGDIDPYSIAKEEYTPF